MTTKHKDDTPQGRAVADQVGEAKQNAGVQKDVATDLAKDALRQEAAASTGTEGVPPANKWLGSDEIMLWEPVLHLGIEAFTARVTEKSDHPVPEEKVYGLLALERNGQNRTPYVQAMVKRLGLKNDELPGGGPDYTRDLTPVSKL